MDQLREQGLIDQVDPDTKQRQKEYFKRVKQPKQKSNAIDMGALSTFIKRQVSHNRDQVPPGIDPQTTRSVFWRAYRAIVKEETSIDLKSATVRQDKALTQAMKNMVDWISQKEDGEWDPKKSLLIYGKIGVGKSTLAQAAHITSSYFKTKFDWEEQYLKFVSMDRLFFEMGTTEDIKKFNQLASGNWIIDEVKEKHTRYKHYGNDLTILSLLLSARHDLWKQQGKQTIITTNIPPKDIAEMVTDTPQEQERLRSRMAQQYTTYEMTGDNKRHPKHRIS